MRTIKPITDRELILLQREPLRALDAPQLPWPQLCLHGMLLPARIVERIHLDGACLRVSGWNSGNGFAKMSVGNRSRYVHRVVYALLHRVLGLPELLPHQVLDHIKERCRFRDCCNPFHLEPVTVKVNTERGSAVLFRGASK